jgi:hypothetical protein
MKQHSLWGLAAVGCVATRTEMTEVPAFTNAQANAAGQALAAGAEETAGRFGPVAPSTFAPGCVTASGDTADADGDTIPATATLTFDCSQRRLGFTGTLTGTESIADGEPNALAWAFTAGVDLHASLTGPFGGSMVVDTRGAVVASQGSALGPFRLASTLDVVSTITNVRGVITDVAESLDATMSYAPDVSWSPGGPVVTGTIAVDGSWLVSVDDTAAEATLSTPVPLTTRPSCESRITAGTVEARFVAGTITVQWSGCDRSSVTYAP